MRVVLVALLAAVTVLRLWLGIIGLAQLLGVDWAIALTLALLLSGILLPLQIATFFGALLAWHMATLAQGESGE